MKKAQFWYADFLLGLLVLFIITFIFNRVIIDLNLREDKIQELVNDGNAISSSLMSPGYLGYTQWSASNPNGRIGLVENGKVINGKLNNFKQLLLTAGIPSGYNKSRILLGTKNDYLMYFEDKNANIITDIAGNKVYGALSDASKINQIGAENIVRFTRFVYYDNNNDGKGELVKMNILVWAFR